MLTGRGEGGRRARAQQIAEPGSEDIVSFEGWVSDERLNDLLHAADAGIVAQKASPYSHLVHTNKMVDYWIFGLPVIASRLRAVSELVRRRACSSTTSRAIRVDLARAIRRLHDDPARREELARNGRRAQEELGWTTQRTRYLAVFDQVLAR